MRFDGRSHNIVIEYTGLQRTLLLLRHGKSAWNTRAPDDYSRPLKKRGRNQARMMGEWLVEQDLYPDRVITSGARRALDTAAIAARVLALPDTALTVDNRLYAAQAGTLLELCASMGGTARVLMLVAHNPGLEQLCTYLSRDTLSPGANGKLMPTAALAILEYSGPWSALGAGCAAASRIVRPRELRSPATA